MTAITWTKTETRTVEEKTEFRLLRQQLGCATFTSEQATAADVIEAIEADEGLRNAVEERLGCEVAYERLEAERDEAEAHATAAESDRDAWKARAEKAERAEKELDWYRVSYLTVLPKAEAAEMARERAERAEKERDTAIQQRDQWAERGRLSEVHKASTAILDELREIMHVPVDAPITAYAMRLVKERDFQRSCRLGEERELGAARERLVTIIDEAFGLQPVIEGTIDDVLTALEHQLFERRKRYIAQLEEVEKERDEARSEVENAKKEIEEARAILYNTGATRGDLLTRARRAVQSHREHCVDWADHEETIARLERELSAAKRESDMRAEHYVAKVARLERELAEARGTAEFDRVGRVIRAMAEWTPESRYGLAAEIGIRWPEIKATSIARLERELAEAKVYADYSGECRDQEEIAADALELRAWRALDEWGRAVPGRRVQCASGAWRAGTAEEFQAASTHVELARELGLIP